MNEYERLRRKSEIMKERYKEGTRIELSSMNDPYVSIQSGTRGTVKFVDDIGTVFVNFDNGSSIGLVSEEDNFRRLTAEELLEENNPFLSNRIFNALEYANISANVQKFSIKGENPVSEIEDVLRESGMLGNDEHIKTFDLTETAKVIESKTPVVLVRCSYPTDNDYVVCFKWLEANENMQAECERLNTEQSESNNMEMNM